MKLLTNLNSISKVISYVLMAFIAVFHGLSFQFQIKENTRIFSHRIKLVKIVIFEFYAKFKGYKF